MLSIRNQAMEIMTESIATTYDGGNRPKSTIKTEPVMC